jgi:2-polyprenyl-3-methyl-5-hydroxy-6-metoxy-1,4-benzoquinol methylase
MEALSGYQRTAAIKAAVDLDLFTAVGSGSRTINGLAARCGAAERGVRILADYLAAAGFLTKDGDGYDLTADSAAYLDRRSPACIADTVAFLASPEVLDMFLRDPAAYVRHGGSTDTDGGTVAPENPVWVKFARAMAPLMAMPAELLAERLAAAGPTPRLRVLDIAAGHGLFGISVAKRSAHAEITALDWPAVLEVATENAAAAGLADRFRRLPGSAFDVDLGSGYDLVLLTNFLHHFDRATCVALLRRVRAALVPGGRAAILEFAPDDSRVTPPMPAMFAFTMLATTAHGDAYTCTELGAMLADAGFARSEWHDLPPSMQRVIIGHV